MGGPKQSPSRHRTGNALRLIEDATASGYLRLRLDSATFMTAAHALYRSLGFVDIERYPESQLPDEYKNRWVFMERRLT